MSVRVTFDELYRRSSQYRFWSYSKDELAIKRKEVNEKGLKKVEERLKETIDVESSQIERVTVDEEIQLIAFHARRISQLARYFNMPSQARATAISFLRKFYLVNSVMEFHPKLVLLTCLFLAAKSENFFISINSFSKRIPKTTPESILSLEFEILQSLKFTLLTHHPFRPLYGFFLDIQDILKDVIGSKELGKIYDEARKISDEALVSDAILHFTPPQIALASFKEVNNEITLKYLEKKFKPSIIKKEQEDQPEGEDTITTTSNTPNEIPETTNITSHYEKLLNLIEECQASIRSAKNPTKEEATEIDKKVQYCLKPSLLRKRKRSTPESDNNTNKQPRTESVEPTPPVLSTNT